jgi:hypothetical protein
VLKLPLGKTPEKLLELVTEIDAMLAPKEERLLKARLPNQPYTP